MYLPSVNSYSQILQNATKFSEQLSVTPFSSYLGKNTGHIWQRPLLQTASVFKNMIFFIAIYLACQNTLREEILAGRKFGGFGGFDKNPTN